MKDITQNYTVLIAFMAAMASLSISCATNFIKKKKEITESQPVTLEDKDGNSYTLKIMADSKQWMTDNLNITIPGSYCYEDMEQNCDQYGRLYTWESAQKGCNILGDGWRLPTEDEWRQMARQYGGVRDDSDDNGKAAFKALLHGGSAEFNALLGGSRDPDGSYARLEGHGLYWTATEGNTGIAWFYNFGRGAQILNRHNDGEKSRAFSVRCIRDVETMKEKR